MESLTYDPFEATSLFQTQRKEINNQSTLILISRCQKHKLELHIEETFGAFIKSGLKSSKVLRKNISIV